MKYLVIRDCMIETGKARVNDIVDLPEDAAKNLIAMGRVVPQGAITNTADRQIKQVARRGNRKTVAKNTTR